MPSPLGHALAGAATGWLVLGQRPSPYWWLPSATFTAFLAMAPDLDLLVGAHSKYTHSIGATLLVTIAAFCAARGGHHALRWSLACGIAYGSHVVLDWLGHDTTPPIGIMALWPFSSAFYESSLHWFTPISRRYWLPNFWTHNLWAVAREVALLGPLAAGGWWLANSAARRQSRWQQRG